MQGCISGTAYTNARRCKSLQRDQSPVFTPTFAHFEVFGEVFFTECTVLGRCASRSAEAGLAGLALNGILSIDFVFRIGYTLGTSNLELLSGVWL